MGVLGNLTKEYFGDKAREEDVRFRWSIDEEFKTRELTDEEAAFLAALARHTLLLDKSLFFQIEDLQRHTKLVLSGERATRQKFPNRADKERELAELDKMINDLIDRIELEEELEMLEMWKRQRKELEDVLDKSDSGEESSTVWGIYDHNCGKDSKVILYVDNIEKTTKKDPYKTMLLMGQVMLHEYFHSFYYHAGIGVPHPFKYAEEPMAEFGSLVVLDSVASSGLAIAKDAGEALTEALTLIKNKQTATGTTAAYGFGAYLFERHKDDYSRLIARYANRSCLIDNNGKESLEYKYLLYPKYPVSPSIEKYAYKKLDELTKVVVVREKFCSHFVLEAFKYLQSRGLLDCLAPFIRPQREGNPRKTLAQDGCFKITSALWDDSTQPLASRIYYQTPFVIGGKIYYLANGWQDECKATTIWSNLTIDEFINMINYVYYGQFDITITNTEYIMTV